ncbi:unnamed protein product [Adineta ricciae]|uniref:RRM domain-containing protein n=1 Tax=Adineta ricciae TaxID=249248 RepID=A0A814WK04_ADIRI|nr:unnamed protein product [Adineta ricciae]CAF1202562.1 unnamed protein product [Adineta ricciae]
METRLTRQRLSSSSSVSRSRSPIANSEQRSASNSPRRGPSTPVKSATYGTNSDGEQDLEEREPLMADDSSKAAADEISSPMMSDTDESHHKKRIHHGHGHHRHRHHKQSKSNKRSISHHRQSVKRSKKETTSTSRHSQSDEDDENSVHSPEKNTSESEHSPAKQEISSSEKESNDEQEEGMIEGNNTPSDRRSSRRHHRKKHRSSSTNNERTSQSPQSTSSATLKSNKGTQLIVNYLPESLHEAEFYQLFARVAPVKLCKLITDRHTGHSYCYGFIEYHSKEDASKAIKKYNGYGIEHKKLKVSYAQPKGKANTNDGDLDNKHSSSLSTQKNPNVYITELPDDFDEKMLKRLFSKYGDIVQAKILRDPRTRISRGVGFVLMTSTRYAERAIKALNGYVPSGAERPISVKYADPKKTAAAASSTSGNHSSLSRLSPMPNVIGSYGYPPGFPSLNMIDPYYAAALHHHHQRAAMNMRDMSRSPPPLPPAYYGSGNSRSSRRRSSSPTVSRSYSSSSSSKHNANNLSTGMTNSLSRSSNSNSTSLVAAYELISKGCQQAIDPNGFVIYAFGLPRDCVEHELEELFQRYGDVYRVYIVKNYTTGESKGYSFITMRNYDEACHAIDSLHNSTFQGRTIQVRFKQ